MDSCCRCVFSLEGHCTESRFESLQSFFERQSHGPPRCLRRNEFTDYDAEFFKYSAGNKGDWIRICSDCILRFPDNAVVVPVLISPLVIA